MSKLLSVNELEEALSVPKFWYYYFPEGLKTRYVKAGHNFNGVLGHFPSSRGRKRGEL